MERQFTFVKQQSAQDHPFRDFAYWHAEDKDPLSTLLPEVPIDGQPEATAENFLTLYCVEDDL